MSTAPAAIVYAARMLGLASVISLGTAGSVASATFGIVCTSWAYGLPVGLMVGAAAGVLSFAPPRPGVLWLARIAAVFELGQLVACDAVGPMLAAFALVFLFQDDATAWAEGRWSPATVEADASGLLLRLPFPLLMPLMWPSPVRVQLDEDEPTQLAWGDHHLPLPPGAHRLRLHVKYLGMRASPVDVPVEVPADGEVVLTLRVPLIVFLQGWIG